MNDNSLIRSLICKFDRDHVQVTMNQFSNINPVGAVLIIDFCHGYCIETTRHKEIKCLQDFSNSIDSLTLDPGHFSSQRIFEHEHTAVRPRVSTNPFIPKNDVVMRNKRKVVESVVWIAENASSH